MKVKDIDQALDWANSTRFGLTGAIFSRSPRHLEKATKRLQRRQPLPEPGLHRRPRRAPSLRWFQDVRGRLQGRWAGLSPAVHGPAGDQRKHHAPRICPDRRDGRLDRIGVIAGDAEPLLRPHRRHEQPRRRGRPPRGRNISLQSRPDEPAGVTFRDRDAGQPQWPRGYRCHGR